MWLELSTYLLITLANPYGLEVDPEVKVSCLLSRKTQWPSHQDQVDDGCEMALN